MGNFYTCTQILNAQPLSKEDFLKKFCEAMKREGYAVCEDGEGEMEYSFSFADEKGCRWATLYSESYEEGNQTAKADTARIAGMLGTFCINTTVIDSDCAILELYDNSGSKVDNLIMGRADDYFGDNIPEPERALWEPLLNNGVDWVQFIEIVHGDYVFVEDGLSKLSEIIGSNDLIFDEISSSEKILAFKKEVQKEKKLTANAAFKQIFCEALEPLGFVCAKKTKMPCFLRAVGNGDVVHVIKFFDNNGRVNVRSGILTIYRRSIDLNDKICDNNWLPMIDRYYSYYNEYICGNDYHFYNPKIEYQKNNNESIILSIKKLLDETQKWVIPVLEKVNSLFDKVAYDFAFGRSQEYFAVCDIPGRNFQNPYADGAFLFDLDDPYSILEAEKKAYLDIIKTEYKRENIEMTKEAYGQEVKAIDDHCTELKKFIDYIKSNEIFYRQTIEELENRKRRNIELLRSYGLETQSALHVSSK